MLTLKTLEVRFEKMLDYIDAYRVQHGCSPSYQEIQKFRGYGSTSMVKEDVKKLVRLGWLKRGKGYRSLIVQKKS